MRLFNIILSLTLFLTTTTTLALPLAITPNPSNTLLDLFPRQTCLDTCAGVCYYSSTVSAAQSKAWSLYSSSSNINSYPHTFNNYEGFRFPVTSPYYEYPILRTFKVYTGGSPGPDRVIFNSRNQYAGLITHTGAVNNAFVECV